MRVSGSVMLLMHGLQVGGYVSQLAPSLVLVLAIEVWPIVGIEENNFLDPTFG